MDRKVAEAVSIAQGISSFDSVTEEEVLGMVQTEEQELRGEDKVEEADEPRRKKVERKQNKQKCRAGRDVFGQNEAVKTGGLQRRRS